MLLSEIFDSLRHGELGHMYMGGKEIDGIAAEDWPAIVSHINLGLSALHKRFPLKYDEVIIQQFEEIQTYYLRKQYALTNSNSNELIKYIMDSEYQPFKENVIKIETVYSEFGEERPINDNNDNRSVFTPQFDAIIKPYNCKENAMSVVYRANHDKIIVTDDFNPDAIEVHLPITLIEPLLFFVANRVLNGMGAGNNIQEANHYLSKYELACAQIETYGLMNKEAASNIRLEKSGWV